MSSYCRDLIDGGTDFEALDRAVWNVSYKESRVAAVAAIDPALLYGLTAVNVSDPAGTDRHEVHRAKVELMAKAFNLD